MNKKKSIGMSLVVFGIIFAVYNLLVFMILTPKTGVFWMSYGFMVLAFGLQLVGMYLSFKEWSVQAVFFGIPLAQFTLFYFFAELFMSIVFMIFQTINWKIPLVLQLVLLAIYAVVAIVSVAGRDVAVEVKDNYQSKAASMKLNVVDVQMLVDEVKDPELKAQLRKLAEAIRYSDPMSHEAIADVEAQIHQEMFALQAFCQDQDIDAAKSSCARLQRLYVERNRKLLAIK